MKATLFLLTVIILPSGHTNVQAQYQGKLGTLKPLYGKVAPVCECEALMRVSIPNTNIISAEVDLRDSSCRVTAIVNHPPANDSVKVWIALPVKSWNGRFQGIGGGGFMGGYPFFMKEPLSHRFATGTTNTGHDGGSGSFALDSQDKSFFLDKWGAQNEGMSLKEGYLALQAESHPVEFRKVELLNLKGCMNPKCRKYKSYYLVAGDCDCKAKP